jgi:hypothetical protein
MAETNCASEICGCLNPKSELISTRCEKDGLLVIKVLSDHLRNEVGNIRAANCYRSARSFDDGFNVATRRPIRQFGWAHDRPIETTGANQVFDFPMLSIEISKDKGANDSVENKRYISHDCSR